MPIDEYITNRLDNQQTWFSKKSGSCQTWYKRLRYAESACILLLPLIGLLTDPDIIRNILLVGIGALASYFRFFLDINAYHDLWIRYRLASEAVNVLPPIEAGASCFNENSATDSKELRRLTLSPQA